MHGTRHQITLLIGIMMMSGFPSGANFGHREIDLSANLIQVVPPAYFEAVLRHAVELKGQGLPNKVYGDHCLSDCMYLTAFGRFTGAYKLSSDYQENSAGFLLSADLSDNVVSDLGVSGMSLESLVGHRFAVLFRRDGPSNVSAPRLISLCTEEIAPLLDNVVPDLTGPLVKGKIGCYGSLPVNNWF
jgi:hypothetical protein